VGWQAYPCASRIGAASYSHFTSSRLPSPVLYFLPPPYAPPSLANTIVPRWHPSRASAPPSLPLPLAPSFNLSCRPAPPGNVVHQSPLPPRGAHRCRSYSILLWLSCCFQEVPQGALVLLDPTSSSGNHSYVPPPDLSFLPSASSWIVRSGEPLPCPTAQSRSPRS
jgi:hypothetical protein